MAFDAASVSHSGAKRRVGQSERELPLDSPGLPPFGRCDNIETHMKNQHATKWAEYEEAKKSWDYSSRMDQCNHFFANAGKSSSVTGHFQGSQARSSGAGDLSSKPTVFVINKDIIEVIIGDMYYSPPRVLLLQQQQQEGLIADDNVDAEDDHDADEVMENQNRTGSGSEDNSSSLITFGSAAEQVAVYADWLANAIQMKERALSLFEKQRIVRLDAEDVDNDNEGENEHGDSNNEQDEGCNYQYVVTIPSAKKMLFDLVLRYISCGVSF